jgi:N-acetylneuraminic acid mutarotase
VQLDATQDDITQAALEVRMIRLELIRRRELEELSYERHTTTMVCVVHAGIPTRLDGVPGSPELSLFGCDGVQDMKMLCAVETERLCIPVEPPAPVLSKVLVVGGRSDAGVVNTGSVLDTLSNEWAALSSNMLTERSGCGAARLGNCVYVLGGAKDGSKSVEVFDIKSETWISMPDMSSKRGGCAAVAIGSRVYVVGGYDGSNLLKSAEVFDTTTNSWSALPDMPCPRFCVAVAL